MFGFIAMVGPAQQLIDRIEGRKQTQPVLRPSPFLDILCEWR